MSRPKPGLIIVSLVLLAPSVFSFLVFGTLVNFAYCLACLGVFFAVGKNAPKWWSVVGVATGIAVTLLPYPLWLSWRADGTALVQWYPIGDQDRPAFLGFLGWNIAWSLLWARLLVSRAPKSAVDS
jgi:hypothetical protein